MTVKNAYRTCVSLGALTAASLVLSGCLGPTYGTDKTSTEQLLDDLGSIASVGPDRDKPQIEYKPRPEIVQPPTTASLPQPQTAVAENNPAWVETPEATRQRLIAEADAAGNDPTYTSPLARVATNDSGRGAGRRLGGAADGPPSPGDVLADPNKGRILPRQPGTGAVRQVGRAADGPPTAASVLSGGDRQSAAYQANRRLQQGAYSDRRRYLSDPPLTYRQPADSAPAGELGETEREKEKRRIAAAKKEGKSSWWPW